MDYLFDLPIANLSVRYILSNHNLYESLINKFKISQNAKPILTCYITHSDLGHLISTPLMEVHLHKNIPFDSFYFILKSITELNLINNNVLFLHGASLSIGKNGYAFLGPSGAGKTTIAQNSKQNKNISILSEETVIIKKEHDRFYLYSSPYDYKCQYNYTNKSFLLSRIFLLKQSDKNQIEKVDYATKFKNVVLNELLYMFSSDNNPSNQRNIKVKLKTKFLTNMYTYSIQPLIFDLCRLIKVERLLFIQSYVFDNNNPYML